MRFWPYFWLFFLFIFGSCSFKTAEENPINSFSMLTQMHEEDYFIVFLVDAVHLDYRDARRFFDSVALHPLSRSRRGDLGHAWIYLQGKNCDGKVFTLEGGHSAEVDDSQPFYFDGVMNLCQFGYSCPNEKKERRYEKNPIKYLWKPRLDGFFQKGSGGHMPTFAAKVTLSKQQFEAILNFIRPSRYPYHHYCLMGAQCCTFVAQVAALVGLNLKTEASMTIDPFFNYGKSRVRLWEDPCYRTLHFSTPDVVEKSLKTWVQEGTAEYALDWYLSKI